ncbi:MAG: hypothetical protein LBF37_01590 [Rickettsiales bacterium]|nr:hypothetical protein [Rickettsiales bacterium]
MSVRCVVVCLFFMSQFAYANIAGTSYIRDNIKKTWGVELNVPVGTIASEKYLYAAIDNTNELLNDRETNYSATANGSVIAASRVNAELASKIKYCVSGTYLPQDSNDCLDCGMGYYCVGGSRRQACTGGIIVCSGINHALDAALPAAAAITGFGIFCLGLPRSLVVWDHYPGRVASTPSLAKGNKHRIKSASDGV